MDCKPIPEPPVLILNSEPISNHMGYAKRIPLGFMMDWVPKNNYLTVVPDYGWVVERV